MKLTKTQHSEIIEVLNAQNRTVEEFSFIKRKGRINIIESDSARSFSYFKKKSAGINPTTQRLENYEHYLVSFDSQKEFSVSEWDAMIIEFKKWLLSLKN